MDQIDYSEFSKVDIRSGTIVSAEDFPEAKNPAYKLRIDLGYIGIKKSSAQITGVYSKDELVGKQVICVVNLGNKKMGPFVSEVLTIGFDSDKGVVLAVPDKKVQNGKKLF